MIPLLRKSVFATLAERAKHTRAPRKPTSHFDNLNSKNKRRISKLRSKKLSENKSVQLESRLRKVSHSHKKTKKELEHQIETLQLHLSVYKDKFEKLTKDVHSKELSGKNQERLGSLVLIEQDLHIISDQVELLSLKKTLSSGESKLLKKTILVLSNSITKKKEALFD